MESLENSYAIALVSPLISVLCKMAKCLKIIPQTMAGYHRFKLRLPATLRLEFIVEPDLYSLQEI